MPLFTAETARAAAILSHSARSARNAPPIQPPTLAAIPQPATIADDYAARKLARVRGQIERVESLLDDSDEPQAVDRFCNALTRLYDLERILAGRPLPGSRRPKEERSPRQVWTDMQPALPAPAQAQPAETACGVSPTPTDTPTG